MGTFAAIVVGLIKGEDVAERALRSVARRVKWLDEERTGIGYWPLFFVRVGVTIALAVIWLMLLPLQPAFPRSSRLSPDPRLPLFYLMSSLLVARSGLSGRGV